MELVRHQGRMNIYTLISYILFRLMLYKVNKKGVILD